MENPKSYEDLKCLGSDFILVDSENNKLFLKEKNVELTSKDLDYPHSVCLIDNDTFVVCNRSGGTVIVMKIIEDSLETLLIHRVGNPSCVDLRRVSETVFELFVIEQCLKDGFRVEGEVVRYVYNRETNEISGRQVVAKEGLSCPDILKLSNDRTILAVSDHNTGRILLYSVHDGMNETSIPFSTLDHIMFPHGIGFTEDDDYVIVADSGSPYIFVYKREGEWQMDQEPYNIKKVMEDRDFIQVSIEEGGYKGVCISGESCYFTSHVDHLRRVDLAVLLEPFTPQETTLPQLFELVMRDERFMKRKPLWLLR